jgi:hypothetical protein
MVLFRACDTNGLARQVTPAVGESTIGDGLMAAAGSGSASQQSDD